MRIVSGVYKGRIFNPPKGIKARPTTDIAKEGLFNIFTNHFNFEDISVLDLFSGTGSISLEFASRGCNSIHLVELSPSHFRFILDVIKQLNATQITPIRYEAFKFLANCEPTFDIIFADPPYTFKNTPKIPELVFQKKLLNEGGWLVIEHSKQMDLSSHSNYWQTRNYGNVFFSFFR